MDLIKQAFSELERTVEKTVTEAASAVVESANEFPKPAAEPARAAKQLQLTAKAAVKQALHAETSWEDYDWQEHQVSWQAALDQLQDSNSQSFTTAAPSQQLQQLYEELLSLPDPLFALTNAAALTAKAAALEANNKFLQQQVEHLQKDQAEVTQLLQAYQEEQAAHAALKAAHQALQDDLSSTKRSQQSSNQLQQQAEEQQHTISSLQTALSSLRKEFETSQSSLFELMAQQEAAAGSATTAEQLAVEEIERLTAELHQLRKDKGHLQQQVLQLEQQASMAGTTAEQEAAAVAGGTRLHGQQLEQQCDGADLAALRAELEAAQEQAAAQQHQASLLTTKIAAAESRIQRLTTELERRPPASAAAAMTAQISALSQLLGQQLEAEGWGTDAAAAAVAALAVPGQLEPIMQERCQKLQQSLQTVKAEAAAAQVSAAAELQRNQQLQQQLNQQQLLTKQLEADLMALSSSSSSSRSPAGAKQEALMLALREQQQLTAASPTAAAVEDWGGLQLAADVAGPADCSNHQGLADGSAAAMLSAVAAQRDRFRNRLIEVESAHAILTQQYQDSQAHIERLQTDNVALVEKIRFLKRYKQQVHAGGDAGSNTAVTVIRVDGSGCVIRQKSNSYETGGSGRISGVPDQAKANRYSCGPISMSLGANHSDSKTIAGRGKGPRTRGLAPRRQVGCFGATGDLEDSLDPETRYAKEYEARLNPFAEFQQNESESRLRGMHLHDKALLAANRLIAGSRMARAAVAVYVVLLHVFLMLMMYYSATPHALLQEVQDRTAVGADAITAARIAAAGAGVGGIGSSEHRILDSPAAGLRLLFKY